MQTGKTYLATVIIQVYISLIWFLLDAMFGIIIELVLNVFAIYFNVFS